jgi:multiple sugar transport system permease protein
MPAIILMSLWSIGGSMLVYLAALQDLPRELVESAVLNGANTFQCARYVVLPYISPITLYLVVIGVIGSFQVFTPTYILTQGGPANSTMTAGLYIYFNAFQWHNIGYASVLSWLLCLVVLAVAAVQFGLARRWVYYAQD